MEDLAKRKQVCTERQQGYSERDQFRKQDSSLVKHFEMKGLAQRNQVYTERQQGYSERDQFRKQYAILAKHLLCHRSGVKIYQIERSFKHSNKAFKGAKQGAKMLLKSETGKALKLLAKQKVLASQTCSAAVELGSALLKVVGASSLLVGGVVVGIALCAALVYQNTSEKPTLESQVKKVLIEEEFDKIQAYLKAYLKCYENAAKLQGYYQGLVGCQDYNPEDSPKGPRAKPAVGVESVKEIQKLMEYKNYILKKIESADFKLFELDVQVDIAELYYQLVKALIEIVAIGWNNQISNYLQELKSQHRRVKEIMIDKIRRKISKEACIIRIQLKNGTFRIRDDKKICNEDAFAEDIFDEIFKCPVTDSVIDNIFDINTWQGDQDKTALPTVDFSNDEVQKYLGTPQNSYPTVKYLPDGRIKKMMIVQPDWVNCQYEEFADKSGQRDTKFDDTKPHIDFDRVILLFKNGSLIQALTDSYETKTLTRFVEKKGEANTSYCIQFSSDEIVTELKFNKSLDLCFTTKSYKPEKVNKKQQKSFFTGYIASKDQYYRVGFGSKLRSFFHLYKGFNFHRAAPNDTNQKLVFETITPIKYFQGTEELKEFKCKITSEGNRSMYMVRDDPEQEASDFGNKTLGEIIKVTLIKKKAAKNEYMGKLSVGDCCVFQSSDGNLEWTKKWVNQASQQFYFFINQV